VGSESKAADRFENCFDMTTKTFKTHRSRPASPELTLLPKYLNDPLIKKTLSIAMRRARAIDIGSAVSPYPEVKAVNVPTGRTASKRELILGAAQPLLSSEAVPALTPVSLDHGVASQDVLGHG